MSLSFSLDHAAIMEQVATFWALINYNGLVAGLLNIGMAVLIWNAVRHMGDADKELDTSEDDIEFGNSEPPQMTGTFDEMFPWHPKE